MKKSKNENNNEIKSEGKQLLPTTLKLKRKIRKPSKATKRPVFSDTISAIPIASFNRLVREITDDIKSDIRWEAKALEALHVDTEAFLIEKFYNADKNSRLCSKKTVNVKHWV